MMWSLLFLPAFFALSVADTYPIDSTHLFNAGDLQKTPQMTFTGMNLEVIVAASSISNGAESIVVQLDKDPSFYLNTRFDSKFGARLQASFSVVFKLVSNDVFTAPDSAEKILFCIVPKKNANDLLSNIITPNSLFYNGSSLPVDISEDRPLIMLSPRTSTNDSVGLKIDEIVFKDDKKASPIDVQLFLNNDYIYPLYSVTSSSSAHWKDTVVFGSGIRVQPGKNTSATVNISPPLTSNDNSLREVNITDQGLVMTSSYQQPNAAEEHLLVTLQAADDKNKKFKIKIVSLDDQLGNFTIKNADDKGVYKYSNAAQITNLDLPEGIVTKKISISYEAKPGNKGFLLHYEIDKGAAAFGFLSTMLLAVIYSVVGF
ncbi:hypothetical protein QR680_010433 [Steinernema hermaphroditum]|uniref:Dolichyl-diphosphooligosaccharide--protein glycosyltransferase subunit 2 n=1 Tax=Steinernema hermaphroditum TaxID=289476 RepID=A0AA39MB78_9BILA|nr:hypothetical protein QR680_010433 [Steinernema hermaphroditum]